MDSKRIKEISQIIINTGNDFQKAVISVLETYRKERQQAKEEAARYKDESQYFYDKQQIAAEKARTAIEKAEQAFREGLKKQIDDYRYELNKSIVYKLHPDFIAALRLFNEFSIPISRTELETLVNLANGNNSALIALNKTLERTESPFRVSFKPLSEYEQAIKLLEYRTVYTRFIPAEYQTEGVELFKETPEVYAAEDLKTHQTGKNMDGVSLTVDRASYSEAIKAVENMAASSDQVTITPVVIDNVTPQVINDMKETINTVNRGKAHYFG